jgi:redox-sensitive bicupin YhaK (pirin superfamily)
LYRHIIGGLKINMSEPEVFRQFSDPQGESHFEALSQEKIKSMTEWSPAKRWRLHIHQPGTFLDWHPSEGDFIITVLSGTIEIGYTDGSKKVCTPGTIRLTSDVGKGHTGRVIGDSPCMVLMMDITKS